MNTDLVSSPCDRLTINKCETAPAILEALSNRKICSGRIAGRMNGLFQKDFARGLFTLPKQRLINRKLVRISPSIRDRGIELFHSMPIDQTAKLARCRRFFCYQHESTGFAIQPIDQRDLAAVFDFKCK